MKLDLCLSTTGPMSTGLLVCLLELLAAPCCTALTGRSQLLHSSSHLQPVGLPFTHRVSSNQSIAVSELGDGTISGMYLLQVELGGQPLHVIADTGSFGLVVSSLRCNQKVCPVRAFNHSSSRTYRPLGSGSKKVNYISGSVEMLDGQDEMRLFNGLKKQTFWEITDMRGSMVTSWDMMKMDGILGLPWLSSVPGENSSNELTVLENFGVKAFTFCLGRSTYQSRFKGVNITPSFIYWAPPGMLQWPSTKYVDVIGDKHWAVSLSEVSVRHRDDMKMRRFACFGGAPCAALIDTGSKMSTIPVPFMAGFMAQIGGKVESDCSNYDSLPDLHFQLSGVEFMLPRASYVNNFGNVRCTLAFTTSSVLMGGMPLWVFGAPFLREFIVEFDRSRQPARIGFSPHPGASGAGGKCPREPPVKNVKFFMTSKSAVLATAISTDFQEEPDLPVLTGLSGGTFNSTFGW